MLSLLDVRTSRIELLEYVELQIALQSMTFLLTLTTTCNHSVGTETPPITDFRNINLPFLKELMIYMQFRHLEFLLMACLHIALENRFPSTADTSLLIPLCSIFEWDIGDIGCFLEGIAPGYATVGR